MIEEDSSTQVKTIKNLKIKHTKRTRTHQALPSSISHDATSYSQILRKAAEAGKHLSISLVAHAEAKVLFSTRSSPGRKVKSPLLGKGPGTPGGQSQESMQLCFTASFSQGAQHLPEIRNNRPKSPPSSTEEPCR